MQKDLSARKKPPAFFAITFLFCALLLVFPAWKGNAADTPSSYSPPRFFETLYDIPIMPGMEEIPEMSVTFDKPSGRISLSSATGNHIPTEKIVRFYNETLKQLGWEKSNTTPQSYNREGEHLTLRIEQEKDSTTISFTLYPDSGR